MSTMEGSLSKWTNVVNGWQYRWFVLDDNAGLLSYYTSKEKMMRGARRGCVRLRGAVIGIDDEDDSTFTITTSSSKDDAKTFHFQTRDGEERERWVRALEDTILRHAHARWDPLKPPPKQDFDRKVAEADAYLQLLIDQIKLVEVKSQSIAEGEEEKLQIYAAVLTQANALLNSVKHTIVQLQIAKNTAIPVNGIYRGPVEPIHVLPTLTHVTAGDPEATVQAGIELGSECLEPRIPLLPNAINLLVPEFSYSSSDEDDDYFDATEEIISSPASAHNHFSLSENNYKINFNVSASEEGPPPRPYFGVVFCPEIPKSLHTQNDTGFLFTKFHTQLADLVRTLLQCIRLANERLQHQTTESSIGDNRKQPNPPPTKGDGSLDYDALYEEESEPEVDSMESHGSVVAHLLSQVKIGMDLTKVALPTFILERRSLLEMYADYFAHPDFFVSIADMPTPRERMVQTVRWYLSSFHAGRKSGVCKKPYNPILGEVFRCHWDIPKDSESDGVSKASARTMKDGPVPWCRENQLTFVSEQVSHHPPVSAFYAEHYTKKISFGAHVWTKSKFLGLSIGVHNLGKGWVSVLDHGEEYVLTFPNGYARSILTVPWIELGGAVTISCAQTGYHATIDFLTKPFYGGKRNRITCQVFQPAEKKPFLVINGEWSGTMEAKWTDGRTEPFVDVNELKVEKKRVIPVSEQEDSESRKVWREVTAGLRLNDMERATAAKSSIEQRQRDEARVRKENNIAWQTKLFKETKDGGWAYASQLSDRISTRSE